jgi:hypothetical protein
LFVIILCLCVFVVIVILTASCAAAQQQRVSTPDERPQTLKSAESALPDSGYVLGPDDQIVIYAMDAPEISGKPILMGENGDITLPLVGHVKAGAGCSNLYLLPTGSPAPSISSLLYSPRTVELMNRMREEFHTVIIDTPPMLHIPDARVLGKLADGVILVVRSAGTTRDHPGRSCGRRPAAIGRRNARVGDDSERMGPPENQPSRLRVRTSLLSFE